MSIRVPVAIYLETRVYEALRAIAEPRGVAAESLIECLVEGGVKALASGDTDLRATIDERMKIDQLETGSANFRRLEP